MSNAMNRQLVTLVALSLLAAQTRLAPIVQRPDPVAIAHVTIVDVTTGSALHDRTVVVRDRRIAVVDSAPRVDIPRGTRIVDGQGRFLMPGLWDMHVHNFGGDHVVRTNFFPLFIANGVTGVRDMWGDCDSACATKDEDVELPVSAAVIQRWKRDIASGTLIGPRLVAGSAIFDGPTPNFPGSYAIRSPDDARTHVRLAKRHNVDFIKVLPGLSRESYLATIDEAKRQGLTVAGHVPFGMSPRDVSDAGQRSIEHVGDVVGLPPEIPSCSSRPDAIEAALQAMRASPDTSTATRTKLRVAVRRALVDTYSDTLCAALFAHFARNHTWRDLTLGAIVNGALGRLGDTVIGSDPRLRYVLPRVRDVWVQQAPVDARARQTGEDSAATAAMVRLMLFLAGAMQRSGVSLLAGTDAPNPWVIPGFALHDELALLVRGGLTPLQALQAATINPARFLGAMDSLGVIARGKLADLVLLDADPLVDIHNTARIAGVVANGRYFARLELDELLAGAERAARANR